MSFSSTKDSMACLHEARARGAKVASCPAPPGAGMVLSEMPEGDFTVFWAGPPAAGDPGQVRDLVGHGAASIVRKTGADRLAACRGEMDAALAALDGPPDLSPWIRFFGGAAFSAGRDGSGCWADFGDTTFILPRTLYLDEGDSARLVVILSSGSHSASEEALAQAERVLEHALTPLLPPPPDPIGVSERNTSADLETFGDLVESIRSSIRSGVVDKVVTARRVTLKLSTVPRLSTVLTRLEKDAPNCTRFAFRIGSRTFVSATPELLVERHGLSVRTEALAGTWALGPGSDTEEQAARLLQSSQKDQSEHSYVVQAIAAALSPLASHLDVPPTPGIRRLARMLHLCSPISATLHEPLHVLDLAARLHPTPAVGGLPREDALAWIQSHESAERGWYAAPFGWVDGEGQGKFVVALRSALLHGDRVHLFAGAGIVRDSIPSLEYQETELKLGAMERALGISAAASNP